MQLTSTHDPSTPGCAYNQGLIQTFVPAVELEILKGASIFSQMTTVRRSCCQKEFTFILCHCIEHNSAEG